MKNQVVAYIKDNQIVVYIKQRNRRLFVKKDRYKEDENQYRHNLNHKCRIKQILYGFIFVTYHPQMNFTYAENNGWKRVG